MTVHQEREKNFEVSATGNRQAIATLGPVSPAGRPGAFAHFVVRGRKSEAEELQEGVELAIKASPMAAVGAQQLISLRETSIALRSPTARGGLAPWQKRRVEAFLTAHLHGAVRLAELSQQVGLSVSHFCRAFRETFGTSPHAHIISLRVEAAKRLILGSADPLSQIAYACGFADQSHLTKQFRRHVGETPHAWHRSKTSADGHTMVERNFLRFGSSIAGSSVCAHARSSVVSSKKNAAVKTVKI